MCCTSSYKPGLDQIPTKMTLLKHFFMENDNSVVHLPHLCNFTPAKQWEILYNPK